ncbi:MAG: serine/threonine-protein kinase, partial [Acidobacteria bacterium]|nr:serine/threonine-protein kinase [Acidobacteriota bacterium]
VVLGGRFRLVRLLGRGSYGDVWLADSLADPGLPAQVAVKIYLQKRQNSGERLLMGEATIALGFDHDRLVRVFGAERIEGLVAMWMEYVEGPTLLERLGNEDRPSPVTLDDALAWLRDIAEGLAYLHVQDPPVVHGDLKLDNVLLEPGGGARLLDFGQTRPVEDRFVATDGTGALPYMAPETLGTAIDGQGRRYVASDIYACGVIAYRFLTGRFPRRTMAEVMNLTPFPRPIELNPSIPEPLDALVMRCLEKRPDRRYATGAELLAAVEGLKAQIEQPDKNVTAPARQFQRVPSLTEDLERLAGELIAEGRAEEAVDKLELALRHMTTAPNLLLVYAAAARAVNKLEVAHLVYKRAVSWLRANHAGPAELRDAMEGRSELDVKLKQYDDAAEGYTWLAENFPEKRWYSFRAGVALGLAGRFPDAARVLQALHESGPPTAVVCAKLGFVNRQLGNIDLAIQYFNEALMLDQHEPVALSQMAEIRWIQGRMDKAEQYLARLEQVEGAEDELHRLRQKLGR